MKKLALFDNYCIKPFSKIDARSVAKHANNKKVWANLRDVFPFPYHEKDALEFFSILNGANEKKMLGIFCGDEAIGGIGISFGADVERFSAELGYWLGEQFWNKGILSAAIPKFCEYAFNEFKLNRIFAKPFANNNASSRVLEKSGFKFEGTLKNGAYKDSALVDQYMYATTNP